MTIRNVGKAGWILGVNRDTWESQAGFAVFWKTLPWCWSKLYLSYQKLKSAKTAWKSLEKNMTFCWQKQWLGSLFVIMTGKAPNHQFGWCWIFLWHCCPLGDTVLSHGEVLLGVKALHLYLKDSSSPQIFANQTEQTKEPVVISFLLLIFFFNWEINLDFFLLCRPMTAQPAAHSFSTNTLNCLM